MVNRENLLIALLGGRTENPVWAEMNISEGLKRHFAGEIPSGLTFEEHFGISNYVCGAICPPGIVELGTTAGGKTTVKKGLLFTRADLKRIAENFPNPNTKALYDALNGKLRNAPKNLAKCVITDLCAGSALVSMGVDGFSYALTDDREFVKEVFLRYAEWSAKVHKNLCVMGFDFIWSGGDIAFGSAPFFSPEVFREVILPAMRIGASTISLPWVYHSDGNLSPILKELLSLGMNALHPFEPGAMDIRAVKKRYGNKLCVIGNVSVDLLARGTPEEIELETAGLIRDLHPCGGYIVSSSNTITDFVEPCNFRAMSNCVKSF